MTKYLAKATISRGVETIEKGAVFDGKILSSETIEKLLAKNRIAIIKSKTTSSKKSETEVKDGGNMS